MPGGISAETRRLDFLVGDWTVEAEQGLVIGRSRILSHHPRLQRRAHQPFFDGKYGSMWGVEPPRGGLRHRMVEG
jgi:hypothetical protein